MMVPCPEFKLSPGWAGNEAPQSMTDARVIGKAEIREGKERKFVR
jgi:hypothetical protein